MSSFESSHVTVEGVSPQAGGSSTGVSQSLDSTDRDLHQDLQDLKEQDHKEEYLEEKYETGLCHMTDEE